mmetsp:Transcript_7038/g.24794  ORF Transcript_7038/g.24794 Transcript_7038/m.24794 type:complete len:207 (-) Transcript_7038:985-1605(-)
MLRNPCLNRRLPGCGPSRRPGIRFGGHRADPPNRKDCILVHKVPLGLRSARARVALPHPRARRRFFVHRGRRRFGEEMGIGQGPLPPRKHAPPCQPARRRARKLRGRDGRRLCQPRQRGKRRRQRSFDGRVCRFTGGGQSRQKAKTRRFQRFSAPFRQPRRLRPLHFDKVGGRRHCWDGIWTHCRHRPWRVRLARPVAGQGAPRFC